MIFTKNPQPLNYPCPIEYCTICILKDLHITPTSPPSFIGWIGFLIDSNGLSELYYREILCGNRMRRDVVSETITPRQPCLVHGIRYPKTEKILSLSRPEFVVWVKRKYQYPVKPICCFCWERYPISSKLQGDNYNRQLCAEKERGRDGFSLGDN